MALWNERDSILKERLFGLSGDEGNHGEDVKEYYYYLDSTPTHSYMRMLYKYPQVEYPYQQLVEANLARGRQDPEFELIDSLGDALAAGRYFDVFIEYAKADEEDILCRISAVNRGPDPAPLHILPHLWYRNTWSWGYDRTRPHLRQIDGGTVYTKHVHLGERWWWVNGGPHETPPSLLFTENETNFQRLFESENSGHFVKDGINDAVVNKNEGRVNLNGVGSKVAAHYQTMVAPGETFTVQVRFADQNHTAPFADFDTIFAQRQREADAFYEAVQRHDLSIEEKHVQRQAWAGLMWSKQFYHYSVELWLDGDPAEPEPPASRLHGRNADWRHLYNLDVLSMPDAWEYPWYAAWDLAFHSVPIAMIDPEWAKRQLILLLREWYMHSNGQLPAYEWSFSDVNPPVHAWAAMQVYRISEAQTGVADTEFLERIFHKLLLNFTWWVNREDVDGNNVFQGGFLGLDNIGVFDRSADLPTGGHIDQADGTAWMAMYSLNMMSIALELARTRPAYEDVATKFFEHFIYIADAMHQMHGGEGSMWDEEDGFYYDRLHLPNGVSFPLKVRSFVGLIPLFAVEVLEPDLLEQLPRFRRRMEWFIRYRPQKVAQICSMAEPGERGRLLLSVTNPERLQRVLRRTLDPTEFMSDYGLRSLSRFHAEHPFAVEIDGEQQTVGYSPAESESALFGGNSNWRGPIWFPVNYLMIEALQKYHHYFGDRLQVELPTDSGQLATLDRVAAEIAKRLVRIFLADEAESGRRPVLGGVDLFQFDPHWRDHILFYEYFHGDNGAGIGASHQTGWTALVAQLIQKYGGN